MSDLKWVADQPTPLERRLLDAAANEAPSAEQRMRVRQALGLSAVSMLPSPPAEPSRSLTVGKAAVGLTVAGSAMVVALLFALAQQPKPPAANALPVGSPALVQNGPAQVRPEPVAAASLPALEAPSDSQAAKAAPSKSVVKVAPSAGTRGITDDGADLSEQLRLVDAARSAVASGNTNAAALALATYGSKFPLGAFAQEAAVLRIETIDLQGNHTQAAQLARNFLAAHPNSPHVELVKRIAGN